mmetsp:Transcript_40522/g.65728  ORF Transcript_40522/g.65728 Transcript_40522/m.65728 type:complete len:232 (-) Transcript_40522:482-1177(-)
MEVLVVLEFREEGEEDVHRLYEVVVDGYIQDAADDAGVGLEVHIELGAGELGRCEQLLELVGPHLHQLLNVGHVFGVVYGGRGLVLMQLVDGRDPGGHGFGVLVGRVDVAHHHWLQVGLFGERSQLEVKYCWVGLICGWFVQNREALSVVLSIRSWDLDEGIDVPHGWDVVGDEGFDLSVQVDCVGLISPDVLEQLSDLGRYIQRCILGWVVAQRTSARWTLPSLLVLVVT